MSLLGSIKRALQFNSFWCSIKIHEHQYKQKASFHHSLKTTKCTQTAEKLTLH